MSSGAILRSVYLAVIMGALIGPAALGQGGGGVPIIPISPEAGLPRPWEEGLQVSPYSVVNLFNGNLITIIQLTSCDPVGPPLEFTLYHNSASASGGAGGIPAPLGFTLGSGWTTSYSGNVDGVPYDPTVTVYGDDGNGYDFAYVGDGVYDPPPGVHDRLVWDDVEETWTLTRPSQWQRVFDAEGRLIQVHDSSGNVLTIQRDENGRVEYVASAADEEEGAWHRVEFEFDGQGRLSDLWTPGGLETGIYHWTFAYDGSNRLNEVHHPRDQYVTQDYMTQFGYNAANRITAVTDRTGATWNYAYYFPGGHFKKATDPAPGQGQPRAEQLVTYSTHKTSGLWTTTYTDRRGYQWKFYFDDDGNFRGRCDPLNHERSYTYDGDHKLTSFTNELGKTWNATYTAWNLATLTTPIENQTWTLSWVQPYPTERPNFWRLTQVTDPGGHWVQYGYEENGETDPTLVTSITEQPDGQGNPQAVTTLEYWHDENDANARGQLKLVTDANTVMHEFTYDDRGYLNEIKEGLFTPLAEDDYAVKKGPFNPDPSGQPTGGPTGFCDHDSNKNLADCQCGPYTFGPPGTRLGLNELGEELPNYEGLKGVGIQMTYDPEGRALILAAEMESDLYREANANFRRHDIGYDALGRPTSYTITSEEASWGSHEQVLRSYTETAYDPDGRLLQVNGPSSASADYTYDELGRPQTADAGTPGVTYHYDAAGRLDYVDYDNGAKADYQYDDANRPLWIEHQDAAEEVVYRVDYIWTIDNLVEQRIESDAVAGTIAIVDFEYDNRHRLIHESRTVDTTPVYELSYEYDQLGNRTKTTDNLSDRYTLYAYDTMVDCRDATYPTNNNRLLMYAVFDEPGAEICAETWLPVMGPTEEPPEIAGPEPVRVVWYTYWDNGDVANITVRDAADPHVRKDLSLCYNGNGTLWLAIWDEWALEQVEGQWVYDEGSYERTQAREFRFDTARGRYLARDVDVATLQPVEEPGALNLWTDYLGETPMLDYTVDPQTGVADDLTRYLPGFGAQAHEPIAIGETYYVHGDLIGSTMVLSDATGGPPAAAMSYTAFGEPVGAVAVEYSRYRYAGAWGYESDLLELQGPDASLPPIALLHVGARWYQPSIGRFVQRDPIGVGGGLNLYAYVKADPVSAVDPDGLVQATTAALPWAGGFAAADGPCPAGDVIGVAILTVAGCIDLYYYFKEHRKDKSKTKKDRHERGRKRERQKDWDKKRQKPDWRQPEIFPWFEPPDPPPSTWPPGYDPPRDEVV